MKNKLLILTLMLCLSLLIFPVLAEDLRAVSITEDNNQFMAVDANKNILYSYESSTPSDGRLVLSIGYNDTYLVETADSIKFVTVNNKKSEGVDIINILFGWIQL